MRSILVAQTRELICTYSRSNKTTFPTKSILKTYYYMHHLIEQQSATL